jgi:hypothetical protein
MGSALRGAAGASSSVRDGRVMRRSRAPCGGPLWSQAGAGGDHRRSAVMDRLDDLSCVDALVINRCDAEMGMSELPLDDGQPDPFVGHLDRVSVPELVRREPPAHPRLDREPAKLTPRGCR